jgi:hypothetical protein
VEVGKVVAHLYVTLIVKELKISVQHGRVVTTIKSNQALNIIFSVVEDCSPNYTQMEGNNLKTSINKHTNSTCMDGKTSL